MISCPALRGAPHLCPQKQCLSGKEDRLSGRTNQRLPPGGSSRRSRVRESALRYNQYKSKVARAPSVTLRSEPPKLISFASGNPCRVPPPSRREAFRWLHYNTNRQRKQVLCQNFCVCHFSAKNAERICICSL